MSIGSVFCGLAERGVLEVGMLLRGLTVLVVFQLLGTLLSTLLVPQLPGAILGMLLLLVYLLLRKGVSAPVNEAAASLLRYLPLMLVPPATAVMLHVELLSQHFWAIALAMTLSIAISMVFCGYLMQRLIERAQRRRGES